MGESSNISAGTVIVGNVTADQDLEVHGRIEGSIKVGGELTVAGSAMLKSDVTAERIIVAGAVAGDVRGREAVVLEAGARVVGDLSAPSVGIRPGALIRGRVEAGGAGGRSTARRAKAPAAAASKSVATPKRSVVRAKKATTRKKAPKPVMPKASGRAKKTTAKKRKAKAPAPVMPARRGRKKAKRRSR
jgi:cytoskeletal protein CcmA (bactofilin family)